MGGASTDIIQSFKNLSKLVDNNTTTSGNITSNNDFNSNANINDQNSF